MNIIVSYRGVRHARGWEAGACLARAFRKAGYTVHEFGNIYGSKERVSQQRPPKNADLWVYVECGDEEPQYEEMRSFDVAKKVFWEWDTHLHLGFSLSFMRKMEFDHVFLANGDYVDLVRAIHPSVHHMPFAIADDIMRRMPDIPKTIDVGTIARASLEERRKPIEKLQRAGINARLVSGVYGEDMIAMLNSFRICINHHHSGGTGIIPGRVWETLGCGVLLLNQRFGYIDKFLVDGEHVVLYDSVDECVDKALSLLSVPDGLQRIADNGYEYGRQHHTYRNRAQTILDTIQQPQESKLSSIDSRLRFRAEGYIFRHLVSQHKSGIIRQMPAPLKKVLRSLVSGGTGS